MTRRKPNALLAALDGEIDDAQLLLAQAEERAAMLRATVEHLKGVRDRLGEHDKKEAAE